MFLKKIDYKNIKLKNRNNLIKQPLIINFFNNINEINNSKADYYLLKNKENINLKDNKKLINYVNFKELKVGSLNIEKKNIYYYKT